MITSTHYNAERAVRVAMRATLSIMVAAQTIAAQPTTREVPMRAGLTIVSAVAGNRDFKDYEQIIVVASASPEAIMLQAFAELEERNGRRRQIIVTRRVSGADIAAAPTHILGFYTRDAVSLSGTTALGPSLEVVRSLRTTGRATYSVKNYAVREASTGMISLVEKDPVPFPVLFNGRRVTLPALHAAGQLKHPMGVRPWEIYVLDHPVQPILLKVAYGAPNAKIPVVPEWTRQVVRIDLLEQALGTAGSGGRGGTEVENALAKDCRVELPGVYFEFNSATLNPQSEPALRSLAEMLGRRADWRISIEGHTDGVGTEQYNMDLSARRAVAVREALVGTHGIASARITTAGFGESRPREPNATPEGRARNRRVELVRPC